MLDCLLSPKFISSVNKSYIIRQRRKIKCFFTGTVAAAYNYNFAATKKRSVTGSTIADSTTVKFIFTFCTKFSVFCACGNQNCICFNFSSVCFNYKLIFDFINCPHSGLCNFCTKTLSLTFHIFNKLASFYCRKKSRKVFQCKNIQGLSTCIR